MNRHNKGRIIVSSKLHTRTQNKQAGYVLSYKPNMLQALFAFSSNGDDIEK